MSARLEQRLSALRARGEKGILPYVTAGDGGLDTTLEVLRRYGALDYTTVVVAEASALPGLQHLAPYAGCAIAEYWMERGRDTLIVYDDLSTHAKTYRELSLLLRRPPGREAYPGDVFSIHAKLLERSTCLNASAGGGSMTALPIVETTQGEIAAYIPTNLISITDGQIYLDASLFDAGFRPAIDIGRSVSRIGGAAQQRVIKSEAGRMKLDYLQFLELEVFTRFGTRLEATMEKAIRRGQLLLVDINHCRIGPAELLVTAAGLAINMFHQKQRLTAGFSQADQLFEPGGSRRLYVNTGPVGLQCAVDARVNGKLIASRVNT